MADRSSDLVGDPGEGNLDTREEAGVAAHGEQTPAAEFQAEDGQRGLNEEPQECADGEEEDGDDQSHVSPSHGSRNISRSSSIDANSFRRLESFRRDANIVNSVLNASSSDIRRTPSLPRSISSYTSLPLEHERLFLSHCWRNPDLQHQKREFFSSMTEKGCVFWADFLDLQDEGAVAWRQEIEDAIVGCSKFVAFIDKQFLLSFNCIEEVAIAISESKPLVLAIIDQEAWDLLTTIGGAKAAWSQQPITGIPLETYDGQIIGRDRYSFTLECLEEMFRVLSSINFCPCRELDLQNEGLEAVCDRLYTFIAKDLDYNKEFAALRLKAGRWVAAGKPTKLLLSDQESQDWKLWEQVAIRAQSHPEPTETQREYIRASVKRAAVQRGILVSVLILATMMIAAGAIGAVAMAIRANHERAKADHQRLFAQEQQQLAQFQTQIADNQRREAERQRAVASSLLLSADREPLTTSGVRAVLRAADEAEKFNLAGVVLPALHATLKHLLYAPYQFLDLEGHISRVHSVDVSQAMQPRLLSCSVDGTIRVWAISWPASALVPKLVESVAMPEAFASDCFVGKWITADMFLAGFNDGSVQVWQEIPGEGWSRKAERKFHSEKVTAVAIDPVGGRFATGSKDKTLALWAFDRVSSQLLQFPSPRMDSSVHALAFSKDGKHLVVGLNSGLGLLEMKGMSWKALDDTGASATDGKYRYRALAFSPSGTWLSVGRRNGDVHLFCWNNANPEFRQVLSRPPGPLVLLEEVTSLRWVSDLNMISSSESGTVAMWSLQQVGTAREQAVLDRQLIYRTKQDNPGIPITDVTCSNVGSTWVMATSSEDGMIRLWFQTPKLGAQGHQQFHVDSGLAQNLEVLEVALDVSGHRMAACTREGYLGIWVWLEVQQEWARVAMGQAAGDAGDAAGSACRQLDWSQDGSMLAVGTDAGTAELWQDKAGTSEWSHLMTGRGLDAGRNRAISFSPDSRWLAAVSKGSTHIDIFRVPPRGPTPSVDQPVLVLGGEQEQNGNEFRTVAWAPALLSGKGGTLSLASSRNEGVQIWTLSVDDFSAPRPLISLVEVVLLTDMIELQGLYATRMDWSPQGALCAMSPEGKGLVWQRIWQENSKGGAYGWVPSAVIDGHTGLLGRMSWSPDGARLAVPFEDNTVRIWGIDATAGTAGALWEIDRRCSSIQWIRKPMAGSADRIACSNTLGAATSSAPHKYDFFLELMMADFDEQHKLLRRITYGRLTTRDLQALRLQDLSIRL